MGRVENPDPEVFDYRTGGCCLVLFGLPFLLGGFAVVLPFVVFFLCPLSAAIVRTRVEASPYELWATFRGLVLRRPRALPTDAIDELEVVDLAAFEGQPQASGKLGEVIVARWDRGTLAFGAGLSQAELQWIRAVLWNVVTAQGQGRATHSRSG